jgi:hypothetical protein
MQLVDIAFPANWNDFVANMIGPRYSSCMEVLSPSYIVLVLLNPLGTPNSKLVLSDVEIFSVSFFCVDSSSVDSPIMM